MTLTPSKPMPAMPVPLSVAAAMMPAMAVPWPLGSVVAVGAVEDASAGDELAGEVRDASASTPVSRTATTAVPRRVDRAVDVVPADPRQRPLVVVAGSSGWPRPRARGRARRGGRRRWRAARRRCRVGRDADHGDAQRADVSTTSAPASARIWARSDGVRAGREGHDEVGAVRRRDGRRRGLGRVSGWTVGSGSAAASDRLRRFGRARASPSARGSAAARRWAAAVG